MDQKHLHSLLFAITAILSPPTGNTNRWVGKRKSSCPSSRGCWSRSGKYLKALSEVEVDEGRYRAQVRRESKLQRFLECTSASQADEI